jgi:hypothetical protein
MTHARIPLEVEANNFRTGTCQYCMYQYIQPIMLTTVPVHRILCIGGKVHIVRVLGLEPKFLPHINEKNAKRIRFIIYGEIFQCRCIDRPDTVIFFCRMVSRSCKRSFLNRLNEAVKKFYVIFKCDRTKSFIKAFGDV